MGSALHDALQSGQALCKIVSLTDAGVSGSRQGGLYLPKAAWRLFSTAPPMEEKNTREPVEITWADGSTHAAAVLWYGRGTRSEFRLTGLGKRLDGHAVGSLLVLVPDAPGKFQAHLLQGEEETEAFCAALGIEPGQRWGVYDKSPAPAADEDPGSSGSPETWAEREAARHVEFPKGRVMAELARRAVSETRPSVLTTSADLRLLAWMEAEYLLYRAIERRVFAPQIKEDFTNVEDFLAAAATLMNRRKSRAGHSLEAHVEYLLTDSGIAFEAQATIDGHVRPDILFPGKAAYDDPAWPAGNLVVLGLKTTCRDRWRQVLNEGKRVAQKHLLTLQPAMSRAQLTEMRDAGLQLIVPAPLHAGYDPPEDYRILTVEDFVKEMRRRFPH